MREEQRSGSASMSAPFTPFPGDGEMARLCRALDWSATPLGPVADWPEALVTTCRLVLASPLSMVLRWGPELVQIYNDAYRPLLGGKHPRGLGLPVRECWPEVWPEIAPIHLRVLETGRPDYIPDRKYLIERHGYPEEAYFTAAYTPVWLADGRVGGVLVSSFETTAKVVADELARDRKRAEDALRLSQERYAVIHDLAPFAIALIREADGVMVEVNAAYERMFGYPRTEVVGRTSLELGLVPDPEGRARMYAEIAARGAVHDYELRYTTRNGEQRLGSFSFVPIEIGGERFLLGTAADITDRRRAEEALRESETRFRSVVENSDDMLFRVDLRTGRYLYISPSAEAVCGHSAEELLAMSMEEAVALIHPHDLPSARAAIAALLSTGRQVVEYRYRTRAGDYRWLSNHTTLVRDEAGNPLYRDGVVRDVTELKLAEAALRESEARFRALFDTMTEGFCLLRILCDEQGRPRDAVHLLVNPAFERLVGMAAAEVVGRTLREVDPGIEESAIERYADVALGGESAHFQARFGPTGRWFEISAYRTQPGLLATVFFDVTDRMRAQEAMREAKEAAEKADVAKTQFLSTLSHELRTPLTAVVGLADLLAIDVPGPTNDKQKEYLARIKASAWHLVAIIDEILTFSRTEAGKQQVRLAATDVSAIARSVVALLVDQAQARGLRLTLQGAEQPTRIVTDEGKLRQILVNLVGNALQYTEAGSVDVALARDAESVLLHVRDTGPGIPGDRQAEIFEPFVQLDGSTTREHGGAGLGLTICRRLARLLGGDVSLASTPGEGSTFTVRLPCGEQADLLRE